MRWRIRWGAWRRTCRAATLTACAIALVAGCGGHPTSSDPPAGAKPKTVAETGDLVPSSIQRETSASMQQRSGLKAAAAETMHSRSYRLSGRVKVVR